MKNKILIGAGVAAAVAGAVLFFMLRGPTVAPAETLLPKDTIYYCGSRSPLKIRAALATVDLTGMLQESAGLTEEESRIVSDWIGGLQGAHIGFRSFTLVPFVLDAMVILEGTFDCPLTDLLTTDFQKRLQPKESYRDVAFQKALIPVRGRFSLEIYITEPVQNRTFITFSKRSLTEAVDRMLDGGPSLADNPAYQEMTSLKPMRTADVIQYVDTQAYLRMFYDWVKSVPQPHFKALADLFWNELRLADYGISVAGGWFDQEVAHSFMRIDPDNPLYLQFQVKSPLVFPYVPTNSCQFSFCRLVEPAEAFKQLTETTVRLKKGISSVAGNRTMEPVEDFLGQLGLAVGGNPPDAGQLLTGELGMWQAAATDPLIKPSFCFYIGINNAERVKEVIASLRLKVSETNGICTVAGSRAVAWSVQSAGLLIANDPDYLRVSLSPEEISLSDTPTFRTLLKKMPRDYSSLKFTTYEQGIPLQTSAKLPAAFKGLLDLFKGFSQMSVTRAENGMLASSSAQQFNPNPQAVRAVLKSLFSAEWSQEDSSVQTTPPLDMTADEAYSKSIDLLSAGRQIDAEELVEKAYCQYPEDVRLLFAQAVLERSRWLMNAANYFFAQIIQRFPDSVYLKAAEICIELDQHESADPNMAELVQLSDANPDDIYLLWLSAIQCREQKNGPLGRERYEKLLLKFTVGPVLLHQTYANILSEVLGDHEASLKHRYIAVSLEAKGWTLQGLANTLTYLKRYDEACAVWARTVQVAPNDSDYWGGWGWTLRQMGRYEEALEKHLEAFRLNPSDGGSAYNAGWCLEQLGRYDEMIGFYRQAAELNYADGQRAFGWCYQNGMGVEPNPVEAITWYRRSVELGSIIAMNDLGLCYEKGSGVCQDFSEATEWYRKAANEGYSIAQNNLGWCYQNGTGVKRDHAEAVSWYQKAAGNGDAIAQVNLGFCCENGLGCTKNFQEAFEWYSKASDQGNATAACNLGNFYEFGKGVPKDFSNAVKYYRKAAEQCNSEAQLNLGFCYEKGQSVEKDMQEAVKWYQKAADQGNATALHNLGLCYNDGKGVEKNEHQAAVYLRKAVETNPEDVYALNGYAWFLATCKDESLRNYPEAVRLAELSVSKAEQNFNLDTLAAAYDRNGQYAKAAEAQKNLIAFRQKQNPDKPVPPGMQKRLEEFERKAAEQ